MSYNIDELNTLCNYYDDIFSYIDGAGISAHAIDYNVLCRTREALHKLRFDINDLRSKYKSLEKLKSACRSLSLWDESGENIVDTMDEELYEGLVNLAKVMDEFEQTSVIYVGCEKGEIFRSTNGLRFVEMSDGRKLLQQRWQGDKGTVDWRLIDIVHYCDIEGEIKDV